MTRCVHHDAIRRDRVEAFLLRYSNGRLLAECRCLVRGGGHAPTQTHVHLAGSRPEQQLSTSGTSGVHVIYSPSLGWVFQTVATHADPSFR